MFNPDALFEEACTAALETEIPAHIREAMNAAHGLDLQDGATYSDAFLDGSIKELLKRRRDQGDRYAGIIDAKSLGEYIKSLQPDRSHKGSSKEET